MSRERMARPSPWPNPNGCPSAEQTVAVSADAPPCSRPIRGARAGLKWMEWATPDPPRVWNVLGIRIDACVERRVMQ
jgi:hypothetical protein